MSISRVILVKSLVKPFYRQHAGLFVFVFTMMFGIVSVVDGAKFTDYHFFLIQGMMRNHFFFVLVLLLWLLYAKKTEQFVTNIFQRPDHSFLNILSLLTRKRLYGLMLWIQFLLLLPVFLYAIIIFAAGCYMHEYAKCVLILIYVGSICLIASAWYMFVIYNPNRYLFDVRSQFSFKRLNLKYWNVFIRYILFNKKILFAGIKIYGCAVLYLMVVNQTPVEYDLRMILLFYSLGVLGHGVLIHQLRYLEESRLAFYRTMPQSLFARFLQYALLYCIILVPEFITIFFLTPQYLRYKDAVIFILLSYSMLLFLNSLLFIKFFRMNDYLKIILCIFFVEYLFVLSGNVIPLTGLLFASSIYFFVFGYYRFER